MNLSVLVLLTLTEIIAFKKNKLTSLMINAVMRFQSFLVLACQAGHMHSATYYF